MTDIVDAKTRSRMMSGIRAKNTKPELLIRKALFARGFRYRLHVKSLNGKPDLVFSKHRAVIFVHGCFWHWHNCNLFKMPTSNRLFWSKKLQYNRNNDSKVTDILLASGWRVMIIWECAIKGKKKISVESITNRVAGWLWSKRMFNEVRG